MHHTDWLILCLTSWKPGKRDYTRDYGTSSFAHLRFWAVKTYILWLCWPLTDIITAQLLCKTFYLTLSYIVLCSKCTIMMYVKGKYNKLHCFCVMLIIHKSSFGAGKYFTGDQTRNPSLSLDHWIPALAPHCVLRSKLSIQPYAYSAFWQLLVATRIQEISLQAQNNTIWQFKMNKCKFHWWSCGMKQPVATNINII